MSWIKDAKDRGEGSAQNEIEQKKALLQELDIFLRENLAAFEQTIQELREAGYDIKYSEPGLMKFRVVNLVSLEKKPTNFEYKRIINWEDLGSGSTIADYEIYAAHWYIQELFSTKGIVMTPVRVAGKLQISIYCGTGFIGTYEQAADGIEDLKKKIAETIEEKARADIERKSRQ